MTFFEPPLPPPEPEVEPRQPDWVGPPANVLGAAAAVRLVLARTEAVVVAIVGATAYPSGFELAVAIRTREADRYGERLNPLFHHPRRRPTGELPPELFRFGIEFADGRKATNIAEPRRRHGPKEEAEGPVLFQQGGSGGDQHWDLGFWIWPLPPPGPLAFVCEWPAEGIPLTRKDVDAALILDASTHAETLWEEDDGR